MLPASIWIGFDPRPSESIAYAVARFSACAHLNLPIPVRGVVLDHLQAQGLYTRPTETRIGTWTADDGRKWSSSERVLWDTISQWTMATEFAISRFLVPELVRRTTRPGRPCGWSLFMDPDVIVRRNLGPLFEYVSAHQQFAVRVVKHNHVPRNVTKMDGQVQSAYSRKNWSSVCLFNVDHPSNRALTVDMVNTLPGRDLHRFCWLKDDEIGELGPEWNHLVGEDDERNHDPRIVHFTNGLPCVPGYENVPFADEWRAQLNQWAAA